MNPPAEEVRSVVLERVFPHAPEKLWRALTDPSLLEQWLLRNDFEPELGRKFRFRNEPVQNWDGVIDCEVLAIEPMQRLSYSWRTMGHDTVVHFTLTPAEEGGTLLRMEHAGFRADQEAAFKGAHYGWQRFLGNLDRVLSEEAR